MASDKCFVIMPSGAKPVAGQGGEAVFDFDKVYRVMQEGWRQGRPWNPGVGSDPALLRSTDPVHPSNGVCLANVIEG